MKCQRDICRETPRRQWDIQAWRSGESFGLETELGVSFWPSFYKRHFLIFIFIIVVTNVILYIHFTVYFFKNVIVKVISICLS